MPGTAPLIEASIRKLGFKPEDIRILLLNHAHFDHAGTVADFKKLTGAKVEVMEADVELLKSGGSTDYLFAKDAKFHFPPVTPDKALKDGDAVSLGDVKLTAHATPGHTRGCTTWVTTVKDGGRSYVVVFADGTGINPGTRFVKNPSYPGIADDYRHTFTVLESLQPDIFLSYHAELFDLGRETGARDRPKVFKRGSIRRAIARYVARGQGRSSRKRLPQRSRPSSPCQMPPSDGRQFVLHRLRAEREALFCRRAGTTGPRLRSGRTSGCGEVVGRQIP